MPNEERSFPYQAWAWLQFLLAALGIITLPLLGVIYAQVESQIQDVRAAQQRELDWRMEHERRQAMELGGGRLEKLEHGLLEANRKLDVLMGLKAAQDSVRKR